MDPCPFHKDIPCIQCDYGPTLAQHKVYATLNNLELDLRQEVPDGKANHQRRNIRGGIVALLSEPTPLDQTFEQLKERDSIRYGQAVRVVCRAVKLCGMKV